jgi:hypothetical protein
MNTFAVILIYGIPASLLLIAIILIMELINPRLLLRSYPKDVQAAVLPATKREKHQALWGAIPFWLVLVGFPTGAALAAKASNHDFPLIFLSAFGVMFPPNLVDWLILDWLIICAITPKFVVLPGTEGMAGYKNYGMHFRGFLIGLALSMIVSLGVAGLVVVF